MREGAHARDSTSPSLSLPYSENTHPSLVNLSSFSLFHLAFSSWKMEVIPVDSSPLRETSTDHHSFAAAHPHIYELCNGALRAL